VGSNQVVGQAGAKHSRTDCRTVAFMVEKPNTNDEPTQIHETAIRLLSYSSTSLILQVENSSPPALIVALHRWHAFDMTRRWLVPVNREAHRGTPGLIPQVWYPRFLVSRR
jgi:hypothetical protein